MHYTLRHLVDVPDAVDVLESAFVAEWEPWYGPDGGGDARADLLACSSRTLLPLCLVAIDAAGVVAGTAALKDESVGSEYGYGPWLAALLVRPEHRGRGVARMLIAAIEREARAVGTAALYCSTETLGCVLVQRDWAPVGSAQSLRGEIPIYRLVLDAERAGA